MSENSSVESVVNETVPSSTTEQTDAVGATVAQTEEGLDFDIPKEMFNPAEMQKALLDSFDEAKQKEYDAILDGYASLTDQAMNAVEEAVIACKDNEPGKSIVSNLILETDTWSKLQQEIPAILELHRHGKISDEFFNRLTETEDRFFTVRTLESALNTFAPGQYQLLVNQVDQSLLRSVLQMYSLQSENALRGLQAARANNDGNIPSKVFNDTKTALANCFKQHVEYLASLDIPTMIVEKSNECVETALVFFERFIVADLPDNAVSVESPVEHEVTIDEA